MAEPPNDRATDKRDTINTQPPPEMLTTKYTETDILSAFDDERSPSVRTSMSGGTLREPTTARGLHISIPERRGVVGPEALSAGTVRDGLQDGLEGQSGEDGEEEGDIGDVGRMENVSLESTPQISDSPAGPSAAQLPSSPRST
jgi:hypothetical protein